MRCMRCTRAKTSARSFVRHRVIARTRHLRARRRKRRRTKSQRLTRSRTKRPTKKLRRKEDKKPKADKKPDQKTDKKVEKKEAKAPKADPKKDPITFDEYVKKLSSRGLAGSDVFTNKRTQKAWDVELIKLSGKLSASAIEASDEL